MNFKFNRMDSKAASAAIVGLCLAIGQAAGAQGFLQKLFPASPTNQASQEAKDARQVLNSSKKLIEFPQHDLKKATDLKSIEIDLQRVKEKMGPGSGSGGDSCALMILANTKSLLTSLGDETLLGRNTSIAPMLENTILNASVFYARELTHEGRTVEAINYPADRKLLVSERFCQRIQDVSVRSMGLLLHEYLGLAGIEDRKYEISGPYVLALKNISYNPRTIDRDENVNFMTGNTLEAQKDILFLANYGAKFIKNESENARAFIQLNNMISADRILPRFTQIQILKAENFRFDFDRKTSICHIVFHMKLDHPQVYRILLEQKVQVRDSDACWTKANFLNVGVFHNVLSEFFQIKAKPPIVMK